MERAKKVPGELKNPTPTLPAGGEGENIAVMKCFFGGTDTLRLP
jgi:hypothetical protein